MAKNSKKNKKNERVKPEYVARASIWLAYKWFLIIPMLLGFGGFAYIQFAYLPSVKDADLADTLGIVAAVCLAAGIVLFIIQVIEVIRAIRHRFEFYSNRVVEKEGILRTVESQGVFIGIYTVRVIQPFWGKVFNYGHVIIDYPGYWNIKTSGLAAPHRLKRYLETKITKNGLHAIISNHAPYIDA